MLLRVIKLGFALLLLFGIYNLLVHEVALGEALQHIISINVFSLVGYFISLVIFYWVRAIRLRHLIRVFGVDVPRLYCFKLQSDVYLANLGIPGLMGEVLKAEQLLKKSGIKLADSARIVFVERGLDLLCVVMLSVLYLEHLLNTRFSLELILGSVLLVSIIAVIFLFAKVREYVSHQYRALVDLVTVKAILLSLLVWAINLFGFLLFLWPLLTFENIRGLSGAFGILSIGISVPIFPATVGQYELVWVHVLRDELLTGSLNNLVALGVVSHVTIIFSIFFCFLIGNVAFRLKQSRA